MYLTYDVEYPEILDLGANFNAATLPVSGFNTIGKILTANITNTHSESVDLDMRADTSIFFQSHY